MDLNAKGTQKIESPEEAHEVFQRVWSRVMPEGSTCPIEVEKPKVRLGCACELREEADATVRTEVSNEGFELEGDVRVIVGMENGQDEVIDRFARREAGLSPYLNKKAQIRHEEMDLHCCNDFPKENAVACLGAHCMCFDDLLQDMIRKELADWLYYRSLSRKVSGSAARAFAAMSAEEMQNAKRLSAAYFLISGIRYWPEKNGAVTVHSYLTALRERFIDEQQDCANYTAAAAECEDHCLCELFLELADCNSQHAGQIRTLVEQL